MVDSGLITLEEIAFNQLMPWLNTGYEHDRYRELLRFVDHSSKKDSRQFFADLHVAWHSLELPLSQGLKQEWKMFAGLGQSKGRFVFADMLLAYRHSSPQVRFYTLLCGHAAHSLLSHVQQTLANYNGASFKKRFLNRTLARIEMCLQMRTAGKSEGHEELLVIKLLNLTLAAVYLELYSRYKSYIEIKNLHISSGRMLDILTETGISDRLLGNIAQKMVYHYKIYFVGPDISSKPRTGAKKPEIQPNIPDELERLRQLVTERQINLSDGSGKEGSKAPEAIGSHSDPETNDNKSSSNRIVGSGEVRKMLGISSGTLKKYRDNEIVPFSRPNPKGKISYRQHDIQKLLDSDKKKSNNSV